MLVLVMNIDESVKVRYAPNLEDGGWSGYYVEINGKVKSARRGSDVRRHALENPPQWLKDLKAERQVFVAPPNWHGFLGDFGLYVLECEDAPEQPKQRWGQLL